MTISGQIIHDILKRQGMFHIVEASQKIKPFKALQIAIGLCRINGMPLSKLIYHSYDVSNLLLDISVCFHCSNL